VSRAGKVLVAGASGVVGYAAVKHFAADPDTEVVGVSRRIPPDLDGAALCSLDLNDADACRRVARLHRDTTHLVYAALYEKPGLIAGWRERDQMETNLRMFANLLDAVVDESRALAHVTLLQGTKAYGGHVATVPVPGRERTPRHPHENFYFLQEDHLRARQASGSWSWTILRPQVILGESLGSNMNLIPALGAYGAVLRAAGEPLHFPGGAPSVCEVVSADLLARAIAWAGRSLDARDEIFNVTNGDVLVWRDAWPAVADALGMEPGEDRPQSLADTMPGRQPEWETIVDRYALRAPRRLDEFVGQSFVYADLLLGFGRTSVGMPQLVSTVKIRQAGFGECLDSEEDLAAWFERLQHRRLLPPRTCPLGEGK
jgi:nucleoside-diphosphate-sugar epimerase